MVEYAVLYRVVWSSVATSIQLKCRVLGILRLKHVIFKAYTGLEGVAILANVFQMHRDLDSKL